MAQFSESKNNGNNKSDDSNVIHLGFNISVTGNPASDFEIYVNDKKQSCSPLSDTNFLQLMPSGNFSGSQNKEPTSNLNELVAGNLSDIEECVKNETEVERKKSLISPCRENKAVSKMIKNEDLSIVNEIENVMDNFEKFSAHLREIPRLFTKKKCTSTPYRDRSNSRSEGNLATFGFKPRVYIPRYDFRDGKYFKKAKSLSSDIFLKPLPGEDYFKKRTTGRHYDKMSYRHYTSVDNLSNCYEYENELMDMERKMSKSENEITDAMFLAPTSYVKESKISEVPKKREGEVTDKQSSSPDSTKDIKIYQSGGIIIMQNFNDMDVIDKMNLGESSKSLESDHKTKEKKEDTLQSSDDSQKLLLNSSSDEVKGQIGKSVQFDLSSCENTRSKSCDSWSEIQKNEATGCLATTSKTKDSAHLTSQNQDFTSLTIQENDSITSNALGMSPSSSNSGKKLEWDSGADVGYLNLNISKENLSTIERIILKGLNGDEKLEANLNTSNLSKAPSETIFEEINTHEIDSSLKKINAAEKNIENQEKKSVSMTKLHVNSNATNLKKGETQENLMTKSVFEDGVSNKETTAKTPKMTGSNLKELLPTFDNLKEEKKDENIQSVHQNAVEINNTFARSSCPEMGKNHPQFLIDKSTYVNTLFGDFCLELPLKNISKSEESGISESSDRYKNVQSVSPRIKRLKKKKEKYLQDDNLTAQMKDKIDTIIDITKHSKKPDNKSKVLHQRSEDRFMQETTLNSEQEDVAVDEKYRHEEKTRFISEKNLKKKRSSRKSQKKLEVIQKNFVHIPKSPYSSPIQTESTADKMAKSSELTNIVKTYSDQIVQTTETKCESKCILAFESLRSNTTLNQVGDKERAKNKTEETEDFDGVEINGENNDNKLNLSCSKSIQVPLINSSLPKHLAHPKETAFPEQNTKSTQYFGCAVTSLPNFHSAAAAKEVETEKIKVLNDKANSVFQNNRTQQENYKNAVMRKTRSTYDTTRTPTIEKIDHVDDSSNLKSFDEDCSEPYKNSHKEIEKRKNDHENKENLSEDKKVGELTDNSRRESKCSFKDFNENTSKKNGSKKSDSLLFGSCDVQLSDEGKKVVLTSELLKEHGDVIDRNIIQEKYFQSQLLEYDRRENVTRGTSMERKMEFEKNTQTGLSLRREVSCQYSPHFIEEADKSDCQKKSEMKSEWKEGAEGSIVEWQHQEERSVDEISRDNSQLKISEILTSDKDLGLTDSLSNSSQTAHSWVPGIQRNAENQDFIVGRALSFEYLPGHLYENKNFREKSISETEQNMNSGDSFQSNQPDSIPHLDNPLEESESRNTVVLENSDRTIPDSSEQMKILDNNLTELEIVVSRLHEKDALFEKITNSMMKSVTKKKTSEMSCHIRGEDINSIETKEMSCEKKFVEETDNSNSSKSEIKEKEQCLNDTSTACQTDTMKFESQNFLVERKNLEKKVNEEKEQQIKWIENEISHLNMLRSLLEKPEELGSTVQRKKRHHYLTESNQEISAVDTLRENILRTILGDSLPRIPTSAGNPVTKKSLKLKAKSSLDLLENSTAEKFKELSKLSTSTSDCAHFGTSLSLSKLKNVPQVTTLPVGVHVTVQDRKIKRNRSSSRTSSDSPLKSFEHCCRSDRSSATEQNNEAKEIAASCHSRNNSANNVAHINMLKHSESLCKCVKCSESQCICLKTEKRIRNKSSRNIVQNNGECEMNSTKEIRLNSLSVSEGSNKSSIRETDGDKSACKEVSARESFKSDITNSKNSSKCDQSRLSSDASNNFEKCQCNCHAEPLPRCDSCNLLNTCKKCLCYRRIKCCLCKNNVPFCSVKKKCVDVASTCICSVSVSDFDCEMCRYSNLETQICAVCSCHTKPIPNVHSRRGTICVCKKRYEERSSQTEKKECTCCKCKSRTVSNYDVCQEIKYMSEKKQIAETQEPSRIVSPSESKYGREIKQGMEGKFPYQIKVPVEKRNSVEDKSSIQIKNDIEKMYPSRCATSEIKKLDQKIPCHCKSRKESRKDMDEHPRHYFLQIEETSEESSEPCENKNSLKVITITVPIRKGCKEDKKQSSSHQRNCKVNERSTNGGDVLNGRSNLERSFSQSNQCNCCIECKGHRPTVVPERPKTANDGYLLDNGQIHSRRKYSILFKDENQNKCSCCENDSEYRRLNSQNCQPISSCQENFSDDEHLQRDFRSKTKAVSTRSESELADVEINYKLYEDCNYHNGNSYEKFTSSQCQSAKGNRKILDECTCCNCAEEDQNDEVTHYSSHDSTCLHQNSRCTDLSEREYMSSPTFSRRSLDSKLPLTHTDKNEAIDQKKLNEKVESQNAKDDVSMEKCKNEKKTSPKSPRKISAGNKNCRLHAGSKLKNAKSSHPYKTKDMEYHNYNKREYMTKSELEREEKKKRPERLTLQECLTIKRPDLYTRAECRRKIIQEKSRERAERHSKRMECLNKIVSQCNIPGNNSDLKLFTTAQMKRQTKKFYKRLPEVTNKVAEEKKKAQFRTNKLLAEVFAKKLQLQALKGCMNLSNSFSVLSTM